MRTPTLRSMEALNCLARRSALMLAEIGINDKTFKDRFIFFGCLRNQRRADQANVINAENPGLFRQRENCYERQAVSRCLHH